MNELSTTTLLVLLKYNLFYDGQEVASFSDKSSVEIPSSIYKVGDEHTLQYIKENAGEIQAVIDYDEEQVISIELYQSGIKTEVHQDTDYEGNPEFNLFKQEFHQKMLQYNQPVQLDCTVEPVEVLDVLI